MAHPVIVIDWCGPYDLPKAQEESKDFSSGLYFCTGSQRQNEEESIQYVGISNNLSRRVKNGHEALEKVKFNRRIWLGGISSLGLPGKKRKKTNSTLDLAEWALIYFLDPVLNNRKKTLPDKDVTIINRWWKPPDYETQYVKHPHKGWPDIIEYLGEDVGAKFVYFKNIKRIKFNE